MLLAMAVLAGCAHTRRYGGYGEAIGMSGEEAEAVDRASRQAESLGPDSHLRCAVWTDALAQAPQQQAGFRTYAKKGIQHECSEKVEAAFRGAEAALGAAEAAPSDTALQLEAVRSTSAFLATQIGPGTNTTATRLGARADAIVPRLEAAQLPCEDKLAVPWLWWHQRKEARAREQFATTTRACLGVKELTQVFSTRSYEPRDTKRCETVTQLAPEIWPRAQNRDQQVALLDAVDRCSDAYSARRNFSFVPFAVLSDYQALRQQRALQDLQREAREESAQAADRCIDNCSTLYADQGGVCTNGCRGDTICVKSCISLGEQCRRNCR